MINLITIISKDTNISVIVYVTSIITITAIIDVDPSTRYIQAVLPDGQRVEAPDFGGGRRLPLRRLLRHRPHHLRLRLTHSRPQPRAGRVIMIIMLTIAFKQLSSE